MDTNTLFEQNGFFLERKVSTFCMLTLSCSSAEGAFQNLKKPQVYRRFVEQISKLAANFKTKNQII